MVESYTIYRYLQLIHVRKIRRTQFSRSVLLLEKHFLGRTFQRTPSLYLSLQRPKLAIGKSPRIFPLDPFEYCRGLKPRILFQ
jgi:hypothetical protein|tara:strand:- start:150 stop:398 length:249 start_codon:yes stop_codon:yes gene_type:complete